MTIKQNPKLYSIEMCREQLKSVIAEKTKLRQNSVIDCQVVGLQRTVQILDFLSRHSVEFKEYAHIVDMTLEKKRARLNLISRAPRSLKKLSSKHPVPNDDIIRRKAQKHFEALVGGCDYNLAGGLNAVFAFSLASMMVLLGMGFTEKRILSILSEDLAWLASQEAAEEKEVLHVNEKENENATE